MVIKIAKFPFYFSLISLLIFTASFKIFGYVSLFYLFIPFIIYKFKTINTFLSNSKATIKIVSFTFSYLIINCFIGAARINDLRIIIYWVPYFIVCYYAYLYHNYKLESRSRYKEIFKDIIYFSSIWYFFIYFFMNFVSILVYKNWYDIQNYYWVGGASSFCISSLLMTQIFDRWTKNNFKIFSSYTLIIIFYSFLINLNNSNLGLVYLSSFSIFIFLASIYKRQILSGLIILSIIISSFNIFSIVIREKNMAYVTSGSDYAIQFNDKKSIARNIKNPKDTLFNELGDLNEIITSAKHLLNKNPNFQKIDNRYFELLVGIDKYQNSNFIEKIFGTGWYSSRITINTSRNKMIDEYQLNKRIDKNKINQLQGIVALLLDTGIIGLLSIVLLFGLTSYNISKSSVSFINKTFYNLILLIHFLCLFIGYPMVMVSYILIFLPKGILFND